MLVMRDAVHNSLGVIRTIAGTLRGHWIESPHFIEEDTGKLTYPKMHNESPVS